MKTGDDALRLSLSSAEVSLGRLRYRARRRQGHTGTRPPAPARQRLALTPARLPGLAANQSESGTHPAPGRDSHAEAGANPRDKKSAALGGPDGGGAKWTPPGTGQNNGTRWRRTLYTRRAASHAGPQGGMTARHRSLDGERSLAPVQRRGSRGRIRHAAQGSALAKTTGFAARRRATRLAGAQGARGKKVASKVRRAALARNVDDVSKRSYCRST